MQDLVGQLSSELKTLAAENDRLRGQVAEMEQAPPSPQRGAHHPTCSPTGARRPTISSTPPATSIASVTPKAEADAAAVVAAGEATAAEIRQQAQLDAELVMGEAQREAEADARRGRGQQAERVPRPTPTKLAAETDAQALLERTNAQVADAKAQLADLSQQRSDHQPAARHRQVAAHPAALARRDRRDREPATSPTGARRRRADGFGGARR